MATFSDLPNELLMAIKASVDGDDLISHVAFSLVSRRTRACYHRADEDFWRTKCYAYGIGMPARPSSDKITYEILARACVQHAWDPQCTHPACGITRLNENCKYPIFYWMHSVYLLDMWRRLIDEEHMRRLESLRSISGYTAMR